MAKNFKELRAGMSAAAKTASAAERSRLVDEMSLHQLRKARELTQTKIADELHMGQGDESKLERRTDMYVSTLAGYLQAVGADLEIRAVFPDGRAVKITQFSEGSMKPGGLDRSQKAGLTTAALNLKRRGQTSH